MKNKNITAVPQEFTPKKMDPFRSSFADDMVELIVLIAAISLMLAILILAMMIF